MSFASQRKRVSAGLAVAGLATLSAVLGAAVMYFELPGADFLTKAFAGGRAWNDRREAFASAAREAPPRLYRSVDKPDKTFDGYTLYAGASMSGSNTQAVLVNMDREVVHRWSAPFSRVWPVAPHVPGKVRDDLVCFFDCHLYPNGDLLVVFHGVERQAIGYGVAKLDKDSNVLWRYSANAHHDVGLCEDGCIYVIRQRLTQTLPAGLGFIPAPCLVDELVKLSPDGNPVGEPISLLEAFRDSPHAALLETLDRPADALDRPHAAGGPAFDTALLRQDPMHTNSVEVLTRKLAPRFPRFRAGQLLVSLRNLDIVAVVDPERRTVVWAAQGPWQRQHDPQFLDNGRLLVFDNRGLSRGSRVLEYDPQTGAVPWSYTGSGHRFYTSERGMSQRLPNGNTLVVNSEGCEIVELSPDKEPVWSCYSGRFITCGRRYGPDEVTFLNGGPRARR